MNEYTTDEMNTISQTETLPFEHTKGFHPLYIFPLLYVLSIYLLPAYLSIKIEGVDLTFLLFLPFAFGVLNIIAAVKFCRPENRIIMLNATVLVKYALIPFFIIGSFIAVVAFFLSFIPVPFMISLGPAFVIFGNVYGWFVLAFEAPYTISYLRLSFKSDTLSKVMLIVHVILQFFFFVDVIDVMFLTLKARKWKKLTLTLIVLCVIPALVLLVLIIWKATGIFLNAS